MLVLKAWVLWMLGQVDHAVLSMAEALQRADAIQHAHSHAYAWYYAAILHSLRGEPKIAQSYAERCLTISEKHEFRQWSGWGWRARFVTSASCRMDQQAGSRKRRHHCSSISALAINSV